MSYSILMPILFMFSCAANANDLNEKYEAIMEKIGKTDSNIAKGSTSTGAGSLGKNLDVWRKLTKKIESVKLLKKGTFESTSEFNIRKQDFISELIKNVNSMNSSNRASYSAGEMTMVSYDADSETLISKLKWNNQFITLLPKVEKPKKGISFVSRSEAKDMFSKKKSRPFFIDLNWDKNSVKLKKILFHGQENITYIIKNKGHTPYKELIYEGKHVYYVVKSDNKNLEVKFFFRKEAGKTWHSFHEQTTYDKELKAYKSSDWRIGNLNYKIKAEIRGEESTKMFLWDSK